MHMYAALYLLLALASACAFYLGSRHQRLCAVDRPRRLRLAGSLLLVLAWGAAWRSLGFWGGGFAMLTAFMLAAVVLPYLDAWRHIMMLERKDQEAGHVG
jgi:hypothetical protein